MDAQRRAAAVYKENPGTSPVSPAGRFPPTPMQDPTPSSVARRRFHSYDVIRGELKGVRVIAYLGTSFLTETGTAKIVRRVRKRTDHGLRFREHRPGP